MSSAPTPVKATTAVPALVFLTAAVWVLRGYVWPALSNVEVAALQAMLDPALFHRDFAVQESLRFTPRFYWNELILLPARAGLPLAWAFAAWHLVALAALLGGVRAIARELRVGEIAAAALTVWLLTVGVGTIGGVYFYTHAPVPAVWAGAAVVWGAAFGLRGRWLAAGMSLGVAVLLQFLVGFYAGVLLLPALWRAGNQSRLGAFAPWALALALVYVPMRLAGGTGAGVLDDATFVEIYARLRLPHHLVPSTWGAPTWAHAAMFYAGAWWFLRRTAAGRPAFERTLLQATLALTVGALALNYVFVELHPLALVAKLQPARITPLAQGVVLALLATRLHARAAAGDWLGAAALALIPFTPFPGLVLMLAAVLPPPADAREKYPVASVLLFAVVLLEFRPLAGFYVARGIRHGLWAALLLAQLVPGWLASRPRLLAGAAALAVAGAAGCAWASLRPGWPEFLAGRFAIEAGPTDAPGILGARFAARSPVEALVLVPPTGETWTFKLYARRAVVVDDKNTPFTDAGLREWRGRMERVLGTALTPGLDAVAVWAARPPEALRDVAAHYGARYVLTRDAWHPALPGRRIDQEQGWSLWALP